MCTFTKISIERLRSFHVISQLATILSFFFSLSKFFKKNPFRRIYDHKIFVVIETAFRKFIGKKKIIFRKTSEIKLFSKSFLYGRFCV